MGFSDIWKGRISEYLDMIYPRLCAMQHLLCESGSIFIHLDWHVVHYVKVLMDEIFKPENFRNEIIIKRGRRKNLLYQFKSIDRMHNSNDSILWYSRSPGTRYPPPLVEHSSMSKWMGFWSNVDRPTMRYKIFDNIWTDIEAYDYVTGYETEKHVELLQRIIGKFSKPGNIVADFFCGSGTALVVASRMGRRWIGCDSSSLAMKVAKERLRGHDF